MHSICSQGTNIEYVMRRTDKSSLEFAENHASYCEVLHFLWIADHFVGDSRNSEDDFPVLLVTYLEAAIDERVVDDFMGSQGDLVVVLRVDVAVDPGHLVHREVHEKEEEVICPHADTYPRDELQDDEYINKIMAIFILCPISNDLLSSNH